MVRLPLRTLLLALGLAAAMPAAAQLYKWVDANGRVQYSDRPPTAQPAQVIGKSGAKRAAAPADAEAATGEAPAKEAGDAPEAKAPTTMAEKEQAFRKRRMEAEEARQKQAKLEAEEKAKADACTRTRAYLRSLESGQRIIRTNEKGEKEFLNDTEIRQETERTRQDLSTHCS